jgi:thiamine-monophosphate kinase
VATELEIIERIKSMYPKIGDDTAMFNVSHIPIVSVDSFVMKYHFGDYFTPYDMGYKALAASISDIAACGGTPKYALISLGLQEGDIKFIEEFYTGIKTIATAYKIEIIGGDTIRSSNFFVSITVIGETERLIKRDGAKEGDVICVTGELGGSFAGLLALNEGIRSALTKTHLNPIPRVKEGKELANYVTAMIDISDGFTTDLFHILEESKVSAKIRCNDLPINKETKKIANKFSIPLQEIVLNGGEEYELLFTIPKNKINKAKKKVDFTEVGEIIKTKKIKIVDEKGKVIPMGGFNHFRCQTKGEKNGKKV